MNLSIWTLVEKWKNQIHKNPPIIIIYWPTACGKTALSIDVAKMLDSEIISADARQIYRWLNIGTGKIREEEKQGIQHHMIDIIDPTEEYNANIFKDGVLPLLKQMHHTGKIPVICGGTGLYIDTLVYNLAQHDAPPNWERREELEIFRIKEWNIALWNLLHSIDPHYADILHPNNYRYVMRGIEVFESTWQSKLAFQDVRTTPYDLLYITPYDGDREKLYNRINSRIETMFQDWLIDEVQHLLSIYPKDSFWLRTIWYSEVIDHIDGKIPLDTCKNLVAQHNRNYAKRQITWNQRYEKCQ